MNQRRSRLMILCLLSVSMCLIASCSNPASPVPEVTATRLYPIPAATITAGTETRIHDIDGRTVVAAYRIPWAATSGRVFLNDDAIVRFGVQTNYSARDGATVAGSLFGGIDGTPMSVAGLNHQLGDVNLNIVEPVRLGRMAGTSVAAIDCPVASEQGATERFILLLTARGPVLIESVTRDRDNAALRELLTSVRIPEPDVRIDWFLPELPDSTGRRRIGPACESDPVKATLGVAAHAEPD